MPLVVKGEAMSSQLKSVIKKPNAIYARHNGKEK